MEAPGVRTIATLAIVAGALAFVEPGPISAQTASQPIELPGTELHRFQAQNGGTYDLYIALPLSYRADSLATYPVLYLTDALLYFLGTAQNNINLVGGGLVEPLIMVGIDRPLKAAFDDAESWLQWASDRTFSLTPTSDLEEERTLSVQYGREVRSGGAPEFFSVLNDEIVPWIEANYRASDVRGLGGHSYGGLFACWVLLTAPESFDRYLIGSPSLDWDDGMLFGLEQKYSDRFNDLPAKVFLSAGTEEGGTMLSDMLRLAEVLGGRGFSSLELQYHIFDGETHRSVIPATMTRGLRYLFGNR